MHSQLIHISSIIRIKQICQKYGIDSAKVNKSDYLFKLDRINLIEKKIIEDICNNFTFISILHINNNQMIIKIIPDKSGLSKLSGLKTAGVEINRFISKVISFFTSEKKSWKVGQYNLDFNKSPIIMGILNVTSDSFSDGGKFLEKEKAVEHALKMIEDGAEIIDIGGESTRPGANKVNETDELQRVIPVIEELKKYGNAILSIDTYKSRVADEALKAGAHIINDISGTIFDDKMKEVIAENKCPAVVMHIQGTPQTMQQNPVYSDVTGEVYDYLSHKSNEIGILNDHKIIIDPGFGFGKTFDHNMELLRNLSDLSFIGLPVLVGVSRKSFIGKIINQEVDQRKTGSLIAEMYACLNGADILRVHDVKETVQVKTMLNQILAV